MPRQSGSRGDRSNTGRDISDSDGHLSTSGSDEDEDVAAVRVFTRTELTCLQQMFYLCCCCCRPSSLAAKRQLSSAHTGTLEMQPLVRSDTDDGTPPSLGDGHKDSEPKLWMYEKHIGKLASVLVIATSFLTLWALFYDTLDLEDKKDARAIVLPEGELTNFSISNFVAVVGGLGWGLGRLPLWNQPNITVGYKLESPDNNGTNLTSGQKMTDINPHNDALVDFRPTWTGCTIITLQSDERSAELKISCTPDAFRRGPVVGVIPTDFGMSYSLVGKFVVRVVGTRFPWGGVNISKGIDRIIRVVNPGQESACVFRELGVESVKGFPGQLVDTTISAETSNCDVDDRCTVVETPAYDPELPRAAESAVDMVASLSQQRTWELLAGQVDLNIMIRCEYSLNLADPGVDSIITLQSHGVACFKPSTSSTGIVATGQAAGTGWQTQFDKLFNIDPPSGFTAFPGMTVRVRLGGGNVFADSSQEVGFVITSAKQLNDLLSRQLDLRLQSTAPVYMTVMFADCPFNSSLRNVSLQVLPQPVSECALVSDELPPVKEGFVGQAVDAKIRVEASEGCIEGSQAQVVGILGDESLDVSPVLSRDRMPAQILAQALSSPHTVTLRHNGSSALTVQVAGSSPGRSANDSSIIFARAIAYTCIPRGLNTPAAITAGSAVGQKYSGPVLDPAVLPVPQYSFPVKLRVVFDGATVTAYPTGATQVSGDVLTFLGQTYEKCLSFLQGNWTLMPSEQSVTVKLNANYAACPDQSTVVTQAISFLPPTGGSTCQFIGPPSPTTVSCLPGEEVDVGAVLTTTGCEERDEATVTGFDSTSTRTPSLPLGSQKPADLAVKMSTIPVDCNSVPSAAASVQATFSVTTGLGEPSVSTVTLVEEVIVASCDPPQVTAPQSTVSSGCDIGAECAVTLGNYFTLTPAAKEFPLTVRVEMNAGVEINAPLPSGMTQDGQSIVIEGDTLAACQAILNQQVMLTFNGASSAIELSTSFQQAGCRPTKSTAAVTVTATPPAPCTVTAGVPSTNSLRPGASTAVLLSSLQIPDTCTNQNSFEVTLQGTGGLSVNSPTWSAQQLTLDQLKQIVATGSVVVVMGEEKGSLTAAINIDGVVSTPLALAQFDLDCTPTLTIIPKDYQSSCNSGLKCPRDPILSVWELQTLADPGDIIEMDVTLTDGNWVEKQSIPGVEESISADGLTLHVKGELSALQYALKQPFSYQASTDKMQVAMVVKFEGCDNTFEGHATVTMQPFYYLKASAKRASAGMFQLPNDVNAGERSSLNYRL